MPNASNILVSWVGHTDLLMWAATLPTDQRERVRRATGKPIPEQQAGGPVAAAAAVLPFDEIHLIADCDESLARDFHASFRCGGSVHPVSLKSPTDYAVVFEAAESLLRKTAPRPQKKGGQLWLNLSSGTPAMAATLVLLGKTRYPARFLASYRSKAEEVEIPFDITVEYLPELLREPDAALQALAERAPSEIAGFNAIAGNSQAIRLAVGRAKRAAIRDVSVLILGESGVGKELFAHAIHRASHRREGPFVPVNCAAIPRELQDSILFGHAKGAFTGAATDKPGSFHEADEGTLFLDEFGDLDLSTQAVLLRALQPGVDDPPCQRRVRRVGAKNDDVLNVRIIAATNREPQALILGGSLRDDLYYRAATIVLRVPALRERRSDIGLIAKTLLARINSDFERTEPGYEHKTLSASASAFVVRQDWPGNVRQLNNVLVQAAVMSTRPTIGRNEIEAAMTDAAVPAAENAYLDVPLGDEFDLQAHLEGVHRLFLERAMRESGSVKAKAARLLGLKSYQTLDAQLKRLGIEWEQASA